MEQFSQVIVLGAGAIGSYVGARCSPQGFLVGRPDHVAAIRQGGLQISGKEADRIELAAGETCPPVQDNALVLVTVKMGDIEAAGTILAPLLRADTVVAAMSNGLDPDHMLGEILKRPVQRVIVQFGVTLEGPGKISCWGGSFMLGPGSAEDRIAACLEQGGLPVKRTRDLQRVVWQKLAVNCVANPLSALTGACNRDLIRPELATLRELIVAEVQQLAEIENVTLADDLCLQIDNALGSSENQTSMLQDILRGRPTEIDYMNGLVAERLARHGLAAPVNRGLAEMVRMLSDTMEKRATR